jgi:hypothetical protein
MSTDEKKLEDDDAKLCRSIKEWLFDGLLLVDVLENAARELDLSVDCDNFEVTEFGLQNINSPQKKQSTTSSKVKDLIIKINRMYAKATRGIEARKCQVSMNSLKPTNYFVFSSISLVVAMSCGLRVSPWKKLQKLGKYQKFGNF